MRREAPRQAGRTGVISWMDELDAKRALGMALLVGATMIKWLTHRCSLEFARVRRDYGHCASWAVWAPEGDTPKSGLGDMSVLDPERSPRLLDTLHSRFVLLGLNISREPIGLPFGNFHDPRPRATDFRIRAAFRETECWGAYMSDVIKEFPETCSGKMAAYLRRDRGFELEQVAILREELGTVGATSATLVAFGCDAERILRRHLGGEYRAVGVPHYAVYLSGTGYRACVHEALRSAGLPSDS
jgi:hypothetical protein